MKKLMAVFLFMVAVQLAAQDKSTITVRNTEVSNGVIIVNVTQAATEDQAKGSFELHCNKGATACKAPEAGSYLMVRLPKNWGMYDCACVDLYPTTANPATDQKLGEYCLIER